MPAVASQAKSARFMGAWVIEMNDLTAADAAIARCRSHIAEPIDVRHTLWGVRVQTDSETAADFLTRHYAPGDKLAA